MLVLEGCVGIRGGGYVSYIFLGTRCPHLLYGYSSVNT
jgi:hypothetical protein